MKKNIAVLVALVLSLSMVFCFAACDEEVDIASSQVSSNKSSSLVTTNISSEETSSFDLESWQNYLSEQHASSKASRQALIYGTESVVASMPDELPVYHDGDIELCEDVRVVLPENRKYRYRYYYFPFNRDGILGEIRGDYGDFIGGTTSFANYYLSLRNSGKELEEMFLVTAIKEFNITREEMELIIADWIDDINNLNKQYIDKTEIFEVPNLDIIYTLDNDIINEYYRYA